MIPNAMLNSPSKVALARTHCHWLVIAILFASGLGLRAAELRPFPQSANTHGHGLKPDNLSPAQLDAAITNFWFAWKHKYLLPSKKIPGAFKVNFDRKGTTVSEAMGYGMLLSVYLAGADADARKIFDGLNQFRKSHPSKIDPALMCWKIPASEKTVRDDCATDGDLDMAFALLLAHRQWGDATYFAEATNYLSAIAATLVRADFSLRLGDWNQAPGQTRPSDFMPAHFRSFFAATQNGIWTNVENQCYAILEQLQTNAAPATGLIPDFALESAGAWKPAPAKFLEDANDGAYFYNSCRVPWRIGWAAWATGDERAHRILARFMTWTVKQGSTPENFRAGYALDGANLDGNDYATACFISPTGVAAMATANQAWLNQAADYAAKHREKYYEDSVSLLSLLVMSGNAWTITNP